MNKQNIDQALAALADALKSPNPDNFLENPKDFVKKIPLRSLSGDHINGGKIQNFASAGILDQSSRQQLVVTDDGVSITNLKVDSIKDLTVAGKLKVGELEVANLKAEFKYENDNPIIFSGDAIEGKGMLWAGQGATKQFIYAANPDRFFVSENIDLAKNKGIMVNAIKILDQAELGPTVTKSNLKEVGRLRGLIVDGSVSVAQYLFFDSNTNRLGLGTDQPNAAFSVSEDDIEIILGTKDSTKAYLGTFASHSLDIVTDNTSRINIAANGNVLLGNTKQPPIQVSVHGKLAIRVATPDPEVDLHVNGAVKFGNKLHKVAAGKPDSGSYNLGDVVWNAEPRVNSYAGWICVQSGSPGLWEPFGKIGNQ